jgi:hypothetical protein
MAKHIIHKQKVTIHVSGKADASFFQGRVSDLLQNELLNQIETTLDELFPSDKVIRIESLHLDLGNLSSQNFDDQFKDEFIKALIKSLSAQIDELGDIKNFSPDNVKKSGQQRGKNGEVFSKTRSLVNSFIYFLQKGYLPWYSTTEKTPDWENELLNNFSSNQYEYFLDWLKDNYQHNPIVIQRLILQFSDFLLGKLIAAIAPSITEPIDTVYNDYAYIFRILKGRQDIRYEIWKYLFYVLLNNKDSIWSFQVLKLLAEHFGLKSSGVTIAKETEIKRKLKTTTVGNAFKELTVFFKAQDDLVNNPQKKGSKTNKGKWGKTTDAGGVSLDELHDNGKELEVGWSRGKNEKWEEEEDTLYVNNSGIVLLHFFLKPFFEDLKIFVNGKFKNDKAHQRAVLLLHYLATGTTKVAEFDLPLQKILCGYPIENTLPASIKLTKKEKDESIKLLSAVIDYWEPMRNTSIEGLRGSFLQRDGKLATKENGWQLTVEQRTIDILLGKIPWGFSTIRLPWMEQILSVDWY